MAAPSRSPEPTLGLPNPLELAGLAGRVEGLELVEQREQVERDPRAQRASSPDLHATAPSLSAIVQRLAELAALRAQIAAQEAEHLANLASIAEIPQTCLAGCAHPSVTALVPRPTPVSAPAAPEFLDQKGLAALLACSPRTVRRMELDGELPASTLVGRLRRWRRADIDAWLERGNPAGRPVR